jgi:hypothetical protein
MTDAAEGDLKTVLSSLDLEEEGIGTEDELIAYLKNQAEGNDYTTSDVDDLVLKVLQIKYLGDYLDQLTKISKDENLRSALGDIDLNRAGLGNLRELYDHGRGQATAYSFAERSADRLFAALAQHYNVQEMINRLAVTASGDLQELLGGLDPEAMGLQNGIDLMQYLLDETSTHEYTPGDVLHGLMDYIGDEDLREIIGILISISAGDLRDVLKDIDLDRDGIHDLADLFHHLIGQAAGHDYTEEDVIKLFLNLLKILENQSLADQLSASLEPGISARERSFWYIWVLGGMLLLLVAFILVRRRKQSGEAETSV